MHRLVTIAFYFFLGVILTIPINTQAQVRNQNDTDQTTPNLDLGKYLEGGEVGINEYYFIDKLSQQLATESPPLEDFISPERYKLGPYDLVSVEAKGSVSMQLRGTSINAQGDLVLPVVGKITLKGLTINEAEDKIEKVFNNNIKEAEVELTLDSPRPVVVHISGKIPNPGRYVLPAGTRVDQLLRMALLPSESQKEVQQKKQSVGRQNSQISPTQNYKSLNVVNYMAPEDIGDQQAMADTLRFNREKFNFRNIRIKHRNDSVTTADLISYYRGGDLKANPYLRSGDIVTLYRRQETTPRISISGAVTSPLEAAYNSGDRIGSLLQMAGGYAPNADTTQAYIYRWTDGSTKKFIVTKDSTRYRADLKPNDRIFIPYQNDSIQTSSAWVHGAVELPGNYPIKKGGTNIANLLEMAGGINGNALEHGAYLKRAKTKDRDVKSPTTFKPTEIARTSNQLLQGFDYLEFEQSLGHNRVPVNLNNRQKLSNIKVSDGDHLYIPEDHQTIVVFGQVNSPGYYSYNADLTVDDYISRANGFTLAADDDEVYVIKAGSRAWTNAGESGLQSGDIIFVNRQPFEDVASKRNFQQNRIQIILSAVSTIAAVVTTTVAIMR